MNSFESLRDCLGLLQGGNPQRALIDLRAALETMPKDDPCFEPMASAAGYIECGEAVKAKMVLSEAFWKLKAGLA